MLIHPKPEHGESWPGFLLRVATENHLHNGLTHLAKIIGLSPAVLIASEPSMAMSALGLAPQGEFTPEFARHGRGISPLKDSLRSFSSRVCPQCVDEMPIKLVEATWDRAFQFTCKKHALLLVERCPTCKNPISHLRSSLLKCNCGASLLGLKREAAPDGLDHFYRALDLEEVYASPARTFAGSTLKDAVALQFCTPPNCLLVLGSEEILRENS